MTPQLLVVVPFFNAWPWLGACLTSLQSQRVLRHRVLVVDDASTDGWSRTVHNVCQDRHWMFLRNETNLKMPHTLRVALDAVTGDGDEVVVLVDGDDWLPAGALERIAAVYEDPDLWLTWGSYTRWPDPTFMPNPAVPYPEAVAQAGRYRLYPVECFNHPITFRRHLWDRLSDTDLKDDAGDWLQVGYDKAIMYPMLELSGPAHQRFVPDILYVYNESNPTSDAKIRAGECGRVQQMLAARPPKERIDG